jgi:flagellar motor component MotA
VAGVGVAIVVIVVVIVVVVGGGCVVGGDVTISFAIALLLIIRYDSQPDVSWMHPDNRMHAVPHDISKRSHFLSALHNSAHSDAVAECSPIRWV